MHCPRCQTPSRVLRTRPDQDRVRREVTYQCKKAQCGAIFVTWEQVLRIIDPPADSHPLRALAELLAVMDGNQRQQAQLMIQGF